jgi:hypothetical protein
MKTTIILVAGGLGCFLVGVGVGYFWFESQRPLEIRKAGNSVVIRGSGESQPGEPQPGGAIQMEPAVNEGRLGKFVELDTDKDGKLNLTEFSGTREPAEATRWFKQRDFDEDGFVSRDEYLPAQPRSKSP